MCEIKCHCQPLKSLPLSYSGLRWTKETTQILETQGHLAPTNFEKERETSDQRKRRKEKDSKETEARKQTTEKEKQRGR
jgi:hypothetical protein